MRIDTVRSYFDEVARRGREPRLRDAVGTWEIEIPGTGTWCLMVDHGALTVHEGKSETVPRCKFRMNADDFLRVARGDENENLLTSALRGLLAFEGDLPFGQRLQALLPPPEPS